MHQSPAQSLFHGIVPTNKTRIQYKYARCCCYSTGRRKSKGSVSTFMEDTITTRSNESEFLLHHPLSQAEDQPTSHTDESGTQVPIQTVLGVSIMEGRMVSYLRSIQKREPQIIKLAHALKAIRIDKYRTEVEAIRSCSDDEARSRMKRALPAFAFAGAFEYVDSKPGHLVTPSGIVTIDLDHVEDYDAVWNRVTASPHTLAAFRSPSGDGIKVLVPVTPAPTTNDEAHRAYAAVSRLLGVEPDPSASDIARLCFVSHDPELFTNDSAVEVDLMALPEEPPLSTSKPVALQPVHANAEARTDLPPAPTSGVTLGAADGFMRPGTRNNTMVHLAGVLNHEGFPKVAVSRMLDTLSAEFADGHVTPAEIERIVNYVADKSPAPGTTRASYLNGLYAEAPVEPGRELLLSMSANAWIKEARSKPLPRQIIGSLIHEREVAFLYASTNVGKSALAVQIADCISRGRPLGPFAMQTEPQTVVFLDCELSDQQFAMRAFDAEQNAYAFDERFLRAELNPAADIRGSFDEAVLRAAENLVVSSGAKVLIVDNLTYLKGDAQEAKHAVPLMKELIHIKRKHGLTMIVVGHMPKRDGTRPITDNDMAGSKMLMNLVDAAVAIGQSVKDARLRYIKQIKTRLAAKDYDAHNVAVCRLEKRSGLLQFIVDGFEPEDKHLRVKAPAVGEDVAEQMLTMVESGESLRDVAKHFDTNHMAVKRSVAALRSAKLRAQEESMGEDDESEEAEDGASEGPERPVTFDDLWNA